MFLKYKCLRDFDKRTKDHMHGKGQILAQSLQPLILVSSWAAATRLEFRELGLLYFLIYSFPKIRTWQRR